MVSDSELDNVPAHRLFDSVMIIRKDEKEPPRTFSDYEVVVNKSVCPAGVDIIDVA